ncbi:MAG TPA: hypothetical protein PLG94_09905, partial [Smithellaceae bacterium]|nr:hypothetical protein [Smithellaceae bacterium]
PVFSARSLMKKNRCSTPSGHRRRHRRSGAVISTEKNFIDRAGGGVIPADFPRRSPTTGYAVPHPAVHETLRNRPVS